MGVKEILDSAESAQPIAEMNGIKIASFDDAVALATAEQINSVELGAVDFNADGTVASTPTKYAAVNVEMFFDNRYRKVEDEFHVVTGYKDYLTIKGQTSGRIPTKQVIADVITADKDGKPVYKGTVTVSDNEFVADFTNKFNKEDMKKILPVLLHVAEREPAAEKSIFK